MRVQWNAAALLALVGLAGCGDDWSGFVAPPLRPAAIAVVSGDNQLGKAGEILPERLVVRVTEAGGDPIVGIEVKWSVVSGLGTILDNHESGWQVVTTTRTRSNGLTSVEFVPKRLGRSHVTATVPRRSAESASFTTEADVLVIHNAVWGYFLAPNDSAFVTIPVGTPVEWVSYTDRAVQIRSISAPPGGERFEARLEKGERFRFVPRVSGDWNWTYQYLNATGELAGSEQSGTLMAR